MNIHINLPNQITLARLGLAIVFFVLLAQYRHGESAFWQLDISVAIFIIAALTDILDGYLARKHGLVTPLGRVLDPFVDKVLVCGAFIMLAGPGFADVDGISVTAVAPWMVVVIVGRELLVTGLRGFNESIGKPFPATVYGKIKMWMQSIAVPVILLLIAHEGIAGSWSPTFKLITVWLTVVATTLSTVHYLFHSRHILEASAGS